MNPHIWDNYGGWEEGRRVNEDWYARRGYKVFKRGVPRYKEKGNDGTVTVFRAVVSFLLLRMAGLGDGLTDLPLRSQYMRKDIA